MEFLVLKIDVVYGLSFLAADAAEIRELLNSRNLPDVLVELKFGALKLLETKSFCCRALSLRIGLVSLSRIGDFMLVLCQMLGCLRV